MEIKNLIQYDGENIFAKADKALSVGVSVWDIADIIARLACYRVLKDIHGITGDNTIAKARRDFTKALVMWDNFRITCENECYETKTGKTGENAGKIVDIIRDTETEAAISYFSSVDMGTAFDLYNECVANIAEFYANGHKMTDRTTVKVRAGNTMRDKDVAYSQLVYARVRRYISNMGHGGSRGDYNAPYLFAEMGNTDTAVDNTLALWDIGAFCDETSTGVSRIGYAVEDYTREFMETARGELFPVLSEVQKRVFDLRMSGLSLKEIGEKLHIQKDTVYTHIKRIREKALFVWADKLTFDGKVYKWKRA